MVLFSNETGDFEAHLPDEIILIIMGFLIQEPISWKYRDGRGSPETQRAAGICQQIGNFAQTCRRFYRIAQDLLFWKHASVFSGYTAPVSRKMGKHIVFDPEAPVPVRSWAHARLLFQPQTLYRVWRPSLKHRITVFDGETQNGDVLFCKHVIPPTAAQENEPTREFYQTRASYEHSYFPGRCYSIFYSVYAGTNASGPFHHMSCFSKEKFHTKFVAKLRVDTATRDTLLRKLRLGMDAVFAVVPDLWFTVKRMDLLQKPRGKKSQKAAKQDGAALFLRQRSGRVGN